MLATGSAAPDLALADTEGRLVRLADHRGTDAVLLYFARSTTCPVCARHVHDLVANADSLAAQGVRVYIVVPEDRAAAAAWRAKRKIPLPVLTGGHEPAGLSRKLFGTMQQSGSVLVDVDGIVRHAHAATLPTGAYDKKGIAAAVSALRAAH